MCCKVLHWTDLFLQFSWKRLDFRKELRKMIMLHIIKTLKSPIHVCLCTINFFLLLEFSEF